jgi:hypothetical protein
MLTLTPSISADLAMDVESIRIHLPSHTPRLHRIFQNATLCHRVCPGRHVADSSAWLAIVQVLVAFDIVPKRDEKGRDILASSEYIGGVVM